ncbi:hypothetical protein C9J41_03215 [Photobacterium sp. GB-50]|uniref:O-antigen polymerase n=1 Tax=Photobacterium sp. GB-50 TaxID=2022107 RepID=UPI000D16ABE3|nr:O-antigen polymerase [Photobacterium sp. GB-50]PSW74717.1 hypothetical protein C9J41_03215 [Photobacterium sp. GB-50]
MESLVSAINIEQFGLFFFIIFSIKLFFIRRKLFTIFDPIVYILLSCSLSFSLIICLYEISYIQISDFIQFILCDLVFFIALFIFVNGKTKLYKKINNELFNTSLSQYSFHIMFVIVLLFNSIMFLVKGFPLFSPDPSISKVTLYTGGFGIVKRINLSLLLVVFVYYLLFFLHNKKITILIPLFILFGILLSTGSKSAFLPVIFSIPFIMLKIADFKINKRLKKNALRLVVVTLLYVIFIYSRDSGEVVLKLITRMLAFGDTYYFYYVYNIADKLSLDFYSYLYMFVSPILTLFHLGNYNVPLGSLLLEEAIGLEPNGFGPNSQFIFESRVFFGYVGSILYCFTLGFVFSNLRNILIKYLFSTTSYLYSSLVISILALMYLIPIELQLYLMITSDIIIFVFLFSLVGTLFSRFRKSNG